MLLLQSNLMEVFYGIVTPKLNLFMKLFIVTHCTLFVGYIPKQTFNTVNFSDLTNWMSMHLVKCFHPKPNSSIIRNNPILIIIHSILPQFLASKIFIRCLIMQIELVQQLVNSCLDIVSDWLMTSSHIQIRRDKLKLNIKCWIFFVLFISEVLYIV